MGNCQQDCFQIIEDLIKLRWVPEILKSLSLGNQRYSEILKSIPEISHTELNRKLIILRRKNVIHRRNNDKQIQYSLLNFGRDLVHIFNHIEDLQEKYFGVSDQRLD